jgi:hypothetical protein
MQDFDAWILHSHDLQADFDSWIFWLILRAGFRCMDLVNTLKCNHEPLTLSADDCLNATSCYDGGVGQVPGSLSRLR